MKKLLLGALLLLSSLSFSQETIGTYQMSYLTSSEPYSVQASEPKNGNFSWYIMCAGETSSTQDSFIIVKNDRQLNDIINHLRSIEKYKKDFDLLVSKITTIGRLNEDH